MFKKVLGVALAAAMVASIGAVAASAAEVEETAVAADDSSSAVGADASEATGAGSKIYFDIESSGWKNYKDVYCHIWTVDGKYSTSWQTRVEKCVKESDGKYSYDLVKWGEKSGKTVEANDGNIYCVIFSADTGVQTYDTIMSGSCIGDTCYVTGNELENPVDSEKKCTEAAWRNNKNCGPHMVISSTANLVGSAYAEGETGASLMANYLITYFADDGKFSDEKVALLQGIIDKLGVVKADIQKTVEDKVNADSNKTDKEKSDIITKSAENLKKFKDAPQPTQATVNNDPTKGNSSNGNNNSNSSNSNGNGSGSVQSGQDMTVFFVFGGIMVAAVGVMFLARKKN